MTTLTAAPLAPLLDRLFRRGRFRVAGEEPCSGRSLPGPPAPHAVITTEFEASKAARARDNLRAGRRRHRRAGRALALCERSLDHSLKARVGCCGACARQSPLDHRLESGASQGRRLLSQALRMKLYYGRLSGHSHRARLFLALLGIEYEPVEVDLAAGAHILGSI